MSNTVTIFKNINETKAPFFRDVTTILERIQKGASKKLVLSIRKEDDKGKRNELKKQLPSICFSGKFNKRSDVSLVEHSGIICLDFDGYKLQKDLLDEKRKFAKNKYVFSVFISPSGKGLKVLVKIPAKPDNHIGYFMALEKHFKSKYFDKTSKNISRVCYESYDPLIEINDKALIWETAEDLEYKEHTTSNGVKTIPIRDENKIVEILVKWWQKKYPMSQGQRNQNAFVLAMAFNDFGIDQLTASLVINQYKSRDFNATEINNTIKSAYSNTKNFNTKFYEDEDKINEIQQRLRRGESKKAIRQDLKESNLTEEVIDSVLDQAEENNSVKFWTMSSKGVVKIIPLIFKKFLETNGYYKFCPEGQKHYVFVKVTDNLIDHTSEKEIKDFILNHLQGMDDMAIYNYFADQTRIFKEDFLSLLGTIEIFFIQDSMDTAYLYYQNCAVQITKNTVKSIDYLELKGYAWKDHVIKRNYNKCDTVESDFKQFISNISSNDPGRILTFESTLGYMMHGHKNISYCPATILNDERISDSANGGTGKGILLQSLEHMKKLIMIDGKAFAFEKSFPYQLVSADTQILAFDDVKKYFDFERLFSVVTEGLTLEKKNKDAIKIPFSKSPKVIITTNYPIKGSGASFARRRWELELATHYTEDYTPTHEFGKFLFGEEWEDDDWCRFDDYMIKCIQLYLKRGLIESDSVNADKKRLIINTNSDFIEWCGLLDTHAANALLKVNERIHLNGLHYDFTTQYPDYAKFSKRSVSQYLFKKWMIAYCVYKEGLEPELGRDAVGNWIRIKPRSEGVIQKKLL
tara:strand:- start:1837 stop:4251 length:2415 start_codon:yes stop_codon:yes gene_type:complete